jgi:hypothetical protein
VAGGRQPHDERGMPFGERGMPFGERAAALGFTRPQAAACSA